MNGISLRAALHVWRRDFVNYRRTWAMSLLPNFFEPVIYLGAMGIGLGAYIGRQMDDMSYIAFLAPGLIVANAMNGATFETTYNIFVKMHFNRTYDAIIATPVSIRDAMLGEVLWAISRGVAYGFIFALVASALGLLDLKALLLLVPVIALTAWLFAAVGLVFTAYIHTIDLYSFYYTLFLTPLFLFSGIFFPLDVLPDWAASLAWLTPLFHSVNLARGATHLGFHAGHLVDLAWILLAASAFTVVGIRRVQHRLVR